MGLQPCLRGLRHSALILREAENVYTSQILCVYMCKGL